MAEPNYQSKWWGYIYDQMMTQHLQPVLDSHLQFYQTNLLDRNGPVLECACGTGLFLLPLLAKRWENIRAMILPTALFSTIQLAATFLHWDKFSVGTVPFYVWFASYLLPPPIFVAAYLWHQRNSSSQNTALNDPDPIPSWLNRLLIVIGSVLTLIAVLTFIFPNWLIPIFPWQLTPLTARSLSGWLIAVGTIMLSMSRENDRTRARLATPMFILILPALLMQMSRFADQVNWSSLVLWIGLLLFAIVGFCGLYLANGSWRDALN